jgi:hypothetical protein
MKAANFVFCIAHRIRYIYPFSKKLTIPVISIVNAMWDKKNECHIAAFFT